jgi:hypothetical protein
MMKSAKKTRALRLGIMGLEVFRLAFCVFSPYTLFSVFTTAISSETLSPKMDKDESIGNWKFVMKGKAKSKVAQVQPSQPSNIPNSK